MLGWFIAAWVLVVVEALLINILFIKTKNGYKSSWKL